MAIGPSMPAVATVPAGCGLANEAGISGVLVVTSVLLPADVLDDDCASVDELAGSESAVS
jgi:hypothetical protein